MHLDQKHDVPPCDVTAQGVTDNQLRYYRENAVSAAPVRYDTVLRRQAFTVAIAAKQAALDAAYAAVVAAGKNVLPCRKLKGPELLPHVNTGRSLPVPPGAVTLAAILPPFFEIVRKFRGALQANIAMAPLPRIGAAGRRGRGACRGRGRGAGGGRNRG